MENIGAVLVDNVQTAGETNKKQQTSSASEGFMAMLTAMMGLGNVQTDPSAAVIEFVDSMDSLTASSTSLVPSLSQKQVEGNAQNIAELIEKNISHFDITNILKTNNSEMQKDLIANAATESPLKLVQNQNDVLTLPNNIKLGRDAANIELWNEENRAGLQNVNNEQNVAELQNVNKPEIGQGLGEFPQDELMFDNATDNAAEHKKQTQELSGQADNEMVQKDVQLPENVFLKNVGATLSNANEQPDEMTMDTKKMAKDFPEIVISKFKTMAKADGAKELVVQLEPKELGKLVVKLTSVEGTVSVKILAHAPVTRELLETGLGNLRQSFAEQGIRFDKMEIELGGEQLNQSFYEQQQKEQESWQHSRWLGKNGAYYETAGYFGDELQEFTESKSHLLSGTYDYLV